MDHFAEGGERAVIDLRRAGELVDAMLERIGPMRRALILPPDFTRAHSWAGALTVILHARLGGRTHVEIMPALGTHAPMSQAEREAMFPGVPRGIFRDHDFRAGTARLGEVPAAFIQQITGGRLDFPIACEVNRLLPEGGWDRIFSIGQVVPHEVIGIANHNKNIHVGVGGLDMINKTHFIGAVHGMERIMGRARSPVRDVLNYADAHVARDLPPVTYLLTVRAREEAGGLVTRGIFAGEGDACFLRAARLCRAVNLDLLERPLRKCIVWLDPAEFKSTWLGNKAIYRTRMAMADGGELIVLGPGVRRFGEDAEIDRLIRKYGYAGTPRTLEAVERSADLAGNLSAAAHLIHGSTEGRFTVRHAPGGLSREDIEGVGFSWGDLGALLRRYDPSRLRDGVNILDDGEEIFFISNPALGLWGLRTAFDD